MRYRLFRNSILELMVNDQKVDSQPMKTVSTTVLHGQLVDSAGNSKLIEVQFTYRLIAAKALLHVDGYALEIPMR